MRNDNEKLIVYDFDGNFFHSLKQVDWISEIRLSFTLMIKKMIKSNCYYFFKC